MEAAAELIATIFFCLLALTLPRKVSLSFSGPGDVSVDEVIQQFVVEGAEHLVGVAADLVDRVGPYETCIAQQDVDGYALEFHAERFYLRCVRYVHALDPDFRVFRGQRGQLFGCGGTAMSGDDGPTAGGVLFCELEADALIRTRDQYGVS